MSNSGSSEDNALSESIEQRSTPVGDFFGPFYRVAFMSESDSQVNVEAFLKDPDFKTVRGRSSVEDSDTTLDLTSQNLSKYAASLTIESKAKGLRQFRLTLTPPIDEAIRIVNHKLVQTSSLVKVQWGYTGAGWINNVLSEPHIFINQPPKASFVDTDATITLTGCDCFSYYFQRRTCSRVWRYPKYKNDSEIIKDLLSEDGFTAINISPETTPKLFRSLSPFVLRSPPNRLQDVSNFDFLSRICVENDVWFQVVRKSIIFRDLSIVASQQSKYNFVFRTPPQTEFDIPVISFTTNAETFAFAPAASFETSEFTTNCEMKDFLTLMSTPPTDATRKAIGTVSGNGPAQSGGGLSQFNDHKILETQTNTAYILGPSFKSSETGASIPYPFKHPKADGAVDSMRREAQFYANLTATVVAPGVPNMEGSILVQVDRLGVGKYLGGPFLVQDVTHSLGTDGYTMRLSLRRTSEDPNVIPGTPLTDGPSKASNTIGSGSIKPKSPEQSP